MFNNFNELRRHFCNEMICAQHIEQLRWGGSPVCPHCGSERHYRTKTRLKHPELANYKDFFCIACRKKYSVLTGSIYQSSKVSLQLWILAHYLISNHKKGISSVQLATDLGITQSTAWYMLHRIRASLIEVDLPKFEGVTSLDETYIGGKQKNRSAEKKKKYVGKKNFYGKFPVMGLVNNGKARLFAIPDAKYYTVRRVIRKNIQLHTTIVSDDLGAYQTLSKKFDHQVVVHSRKRYVNSEGYSTNNVENLWSILKRGIVGIYHKVSQGHLQLYCNEFEFRYNHRDVSPIQRFEESIRRCDRAQLLYKNLTDKEYGQQQFRPAARKRKTQGA